MIIGYNKNSFEKVEKHLFEYKDTRDYRFLFSSKEWIRAYIEIFNPQKNFLIFSKRKENYFSLSLNKDGFVFTGSPFNDFNGFQIRRSEDLFDFPEILFRLSKFHDQFMWEELFEKKQADILLDISFKVDNSRDRTVSLKIDASEIPYEEIISRKIIRNYSKFAEGICFRRLNGKQLSEQKNLLQVLFQYRQNKLLSRKDGENSPSVGSRFNYFIEKFVYADTVAENIIFDYCYDRKSLHYLALSLSFVKDNKVICYLRAHAPSSNHISFGLILDYWSINHNFQNGINIVDFTRGNESYKYRLGAEEYHLYNI